MVDDKKLEPKLPAGMADMFHDDEVENEGMLDVFSKWANQKLKTGKKRMAEVE